MSVPPFRHLFRFTKNSPSKSSAVVAVDPDASASQQSVGEGGGSGGTDEGIAAGDTHPMVVCTGHFKTEKMIRALSYILYK